MIDGDYPRRERQEAVDFLINELTTLQEKVERVKKILRDASSTDMPYTAIESARRILEEEP